jgi:tetratricopeptide (TPR) repeat protein
MAADTPAFLAGRGIHVTTGAAPGYVEDALCAGCHQDLAASFAAVGMSRSFYRPRRATSIETFGVPFEHALSKRTYEMLWRGDQLVFRRWQLGPRGERVHEVEQAVDWVLGSGNHARTYLFRSPSGELWQLPIAWYTREASGGWRRATTAPTTRSCRARCSASAWSATTRTPSSLRAPTLRHAAPLPGGAAGRRRLPALPRAGRRARAAGARLRRAARRCQGRDRQPGAPRAARRAEVCYQCHLQPIVALPAVRRFERGDLAFRPGEPLAAHRVELDADEEGRSRDERFEINHHPYRLEQSRCFRESPVGALSCLNCHDPHRKVAAADRAAHYRAACLSCHEVAKHPPGRSSATLRLHELPHARAAHRGRRARGDDGPSHSAPARRRRRPAGARAPSAIPVLVGAQLSCAPTRRRRGASASSTAPSACCASAAAARCRGWRRCSPRRRRYPPSRGCDSAWSSLQTRGYADAEASLRRAMATPGGDTPLARVWLGLSFAGQGRLEESLAELAAAAVRDPDLVEAHFNRGRLLLANGRAAEALPELERAVALRPTFAAGWLRLGEAKEALAPTSDRKAATASRAAAIADYRRALAVEPSTTEAYLALARALRAQGDEAGARSVLALGARFARHPEAL